MFTKIMVPLDGTTLAESILPCVTRMALGLDVPAVLFNVAESAAKQSESSPINEMSGYLGDVGVRLAGFGLRVDSLISSGYAAGQIIRVARDQGCDLIATATHGRNIFGRIYRGSVTDSVIRRFRIPTLTVRPQQARRRTADERGRYLERRRSVGRLVILRRRDALRGRARRGVVAGGVARPGHQHRRTAHLDARRGRLRRIDSGGFDGRSRASQHHDRKLRDRGLKVESKLLIGAPTEGVLGVVRDNPGSMVVMSTHGRWGFARWSEGNVTHEVVRSSEAPVLVIPPHVEV